MFGIVAYFSLLTTIHGIYVFLRMIYRYSFSNSFLIFFKLGFDLFFVNLIQYCEAFLKFIKTKIHLLNEMLEKGNFEETTVENKIKEIMKIHSVALNLIAKLDNILNMMMFLMYSANSFTLIFLLSVVGI